jgi:single-strand DNA-binding protein
MINRVQLIGYAGGDPDLKTLESGAQVARVSLATSESWKDKEGNWQSATDWHSLILWREMAEKAEKQIKKGSLLYVEGKISYRKYTTADGVEKYITDIVVSTFRLLEKKDGAHEERFPAEEPHTKAVQPPSNATPTDVPPAGSGDDLPF